MSNKALGILSLLLGLFGVSVLFFVNIQRMLIISSDLFINRYSLVLIYIYIFLTFIVLGMLMLKGTIVPYINTSTKVERTKNQLIVRAFFVPLLIFVTFQSFTTFDLGFIKYGVLAIAIVEIIGFSKNYKNIKSRT